MVIDILDIIIVAVVVLFVIPQIILWVRFSRNNRDRYVRDSIRVIAKQRNMIPFSSNKREGLGKGFVYCPHPVTNWSLNPQYLNDDCDYDHTIDGFRKTSDFSSIDEAVKRYPDALKIVCVGGSTTYCTGMKTYKDSWPSQLTNKITDKNVLVFNFGVGGWNQIQSLIRCVNWLPLIKPDIVILYQAKNDFTPLYNGNPNELKVYPDYQNLMSQFSQCLNTGINRWLMYIPIFMLWCRIKIPSASIQCAYGDSATLDPSGLDRLDESLMNSILFRTETIFSLCNRLGAKVLYMPEIVRSGVYVSSLDSLYLRVQELVKKSSNVHYFDPRLVMPLEDEYYLDKMHFSLKGCNVFAETVAAQINLMLDSSDK